MTRRCPRNDATRFSGSAEEPSDLSDILSLTSEEETLTSCTSSLSVVTSSWDDTVLGNNTTRTSSYSLREDKFDREASNDVRQMFETIDCELYGDSFVGCPSSHPGGRVVSQRLKRGFRAEDEELDWSPRGTGSGQRQQRECIGEWKNTFPHMRICGVSLTGASDEGFQVYPTIVEETTPPRTSTATSADSRRRSNAGLNGLKITGRNVDTISMTLSNTERRRRSLSGEEIFESDGNLEEIIAIDYRNVEEMGQRSAGDGLQRTGFPPITPIACVRSSLIDSVFDVTWQQIVSELRPFLRKHCHLEADRIDNSVSRFMHQVMMGGGVGGGAAASRFHSPPDRHPSRSPPPLPPPPPPPHESSPVRSISTPEKPPSRHSARERNQLTDLLRINRKTLLTRDKIDANLLPSHPHPHSASSSSSASAASASSSSILFVHLPGDSSRMTDHLLSPGRHRYGARDRLEVIHDDDDHGPSVAITTTIQIRGQRLQQGSSKIDPLSSLSILPPINPELSRLSSSSRAPNRRFHYRVTSALAPKTGRLFPAERPAAIPQSRPVTESGLYHRVDVPNTRPNGRRHSATNNTSNNNMRNLLKTMMDASNAQPQVKGIGLQRYHTVIS